jgi:hypothetical protein
MIPGHVPDPRNALCAIGAEGPGTRSGKAKALLLEYTGGASMAELAEIGL